MSKNKPTYEELEQRCLAAERKLTEAALHSNIERLNLALEAAQAGMWEWDLRTNENIWSEELWQLYGLEPHSCQPSYEMWLQTIHPSDRARVAQAVQKAAENGTDLNTEWRVLGHDGTERWLMSQGRPTRDAHGQVVRFTGIVLDITARKQAQAEIRESETRYRNLFENMVEGYAYCQMIFAEGQAQDWIYLDVNLAFGTLTGLKDVVGKRASEIIPGIRQKDPNLLEVYSRVATTGNLEQFESYIESWQMWVSATVYCPKPGYFVTMFDKITERKQAEAALLEGQNIMRAWLNAIQESALLLDLDGTILVANETVSRRLRGAVEEIVGLSMYDLVPEHTAHVRRTHVAEVIQSGQPARFEDERFGRLIDNTIYPVFDADRRVKYLAVLGNDITERRQAEEQLNYQTAVLITLLNSPQETVALLDTAGKVLHINEKGAARFGMSPQEMVGQNIYELLPEPVASERKRIIAEIMRTGQYANFEDQREGLYFMNSIYAVDEPQTGELLGVASFAKDITKRKQAEAEVRQLNVELEQRVAERTSELSDLYNNAPCGYHSLDSTGLFLRINDTELTWLGYNREEIVGKMKAADLFTAASVETFNHNFPVFIERGWLENLELDMIRKDGSILPVLLSATAVTDENGRFLMSRSTMIDYTGLKQSETALRQSQAKLQTANKELEAFAYSVSHDLRAPLRGIDGWSLALLEDYYEQLDETARQYLDRVRGEAQRMGRLIDDMLQLSRITRAEMRYAPVNLTNLASTVANRLQEENPERQVNVIIQPNLTTHGDAALLEIALNNLLGNAFKFSSQRAEAQVEFGSLPLASSTPEKKSPVFFVRDNGAGFDMAYASKLFGAFQRMHKASDFPGSGIGLAIVQRIIHRHGGQVWAEAQVDRGATFYFTLEGTK